MPFSGFQDLDPRFAGSLEQMIAAQPGISVGSGYRTPQRQAELFRNAVAKYGSEAAARHWVAPPGRSRHNMHLAADLQFASPAARQWAHDNAAKYGLTFPMGHEAWHIEPIGARGGGAMPPQIPTSAAGAMMAANPTGTPQPFAPMFGDAVAPQGVQTSLVPPTDMGSLAYNFIQQAEDRRSREQAERDAEEQRRIAMFTPPDPTPPGIAGLYA